MWLHFIKKELKKIKDFTFVLFFRGYMTKFRPLNPEKHNLCNYYVKCFFFFLILFGQICISVVDVYFSLYIYIYIYAPVLLLQGHYQIALFPTLTMIILPPGSDSCFTKMKPCLTHGLSTFTKILILLSPFGLSDGGLSLVQPLKYFLHNDRLFQKFLIKVQTWHS